MSPLIEVLLAAIVLVGLAYLLGGMILGGMITKNMEERRGKRS
jgi:hypothetical protein